MSAETWTVEDCATHWGVQPSTWRDYVSKGYAPPPLPYYDEQRRRRWDPDTVRNYRRPGRGIRRTDLLPPSESEQGNA